MITCYFAFSMLITLVWEERADFSAIDYLLFCVFCFEGFPLHLCAWDRLQHLFAALPGPPILLYKENKDNRFVFRKSKRM